MGMAAAAWDVLAKAANLAQMSGLHAAMLVVVLTTLLRVQRSNMRECARLERCHHRLHALPCSETAGDPFGEALADAARLVDSYKGSSLWRRLWGGGRMATQLRDMQDVVDSYCGLLLFVNAHLLLQQQATHRHPVSPSSDTSTTTTYARFMRRMTSHKVQQIVTLEERMIFVREDVTPTKLDAKEMRLLCCP